MRRSGCVGVSLRIAFHMCYRVISGCSSSNGKSERTEIRPRIGRLSVSLSVIGTDTHDFLLVIHITVGLFRTVSEINGDFGGKSHFPTLSI